MPAVVTTTHDNNSPLHFACTINAGKTISSVIRDAEKVKYFLPHLFCAPLLASAKKKTLAYAFPSLFFPIFASSPQEVLTAPKNLDHNDVAFAVGSALQSQLDSRSEALSALLVHRRCAVLTSRGHIRDD